ncbi:MAG: hypothetical protein KAU28_03945 [Phycisphaerae bacterium]|nr:hypothetical protein [Phycisphaerae bacterium]
MSKTSSYMQSFPRLSRRWWLGFARNLIWVVIVTVLVWIYADMEFTTEREFTATIRLTAEKNKELVIISNNTETKVAFNLEGNRSGLDRFERWLNKQTSPITYDVSESYGAGDHPILTESVLSEITEISKLGLTVRSPSPSTIRISLDSRVRVPDVPVRFDFSGATLEEAPVITPAKVAIFVAKSKLGKIEVRELKTNPLDLTNLPTDQPITRKLDISPFIENIRVEPELKTVEVAFKISQLTGTKTIAVTVKVLQPPTWAADETWKQYELKGKDDPLEWRKEIQVTGTKKDLERLRPEDVDAYITLRDDDKKPVDSWLTRDVTIRFPEALDVRLAGEQPKVNFKLVKRQLLPAMPPAPPAAP